MEISKQKIQKPGFSLLETTVALAVLMISIVGPLTLVASSLRSVSIAKNTLIASSLAEEGIELVRTIRSTNVLKSTDWLAGMGFCTNSAGCAIDAENLAVSACGAVCPPLLFDDALNFYNYQSGSVTNFSRQIKITELVPEQEIKASVTVFWQEKFGPKSFSLTESIFNW